MIRHTDIAAAHASREIGEPERISGAIFREREKITVQLRLERRYLSHTTGDAAKTRNVAHRSVAQVESIILLGKSAKWA